MRAKKQSNSLTDAKAALLAAAHDLREDHPGCGVEKIYDTLAPCWVGRDKCCQLLMEAGFRLKRRINYRRTTYSVRTHYKNLIEGMLLTGKNQVWQSDITYIRVTGKWYYLVFIIDVYTKVIIGYCASNNMRAEANIKALNMAVKSQSPNSLQRLVHHSDRGSQYHDHQYIQMLNDSKISISMCVKGRDNAYAERVNGIIKNEYLNLKYINSLHELKRELKSSIQHYNSSRIHRSLPGNITPKQFENDIVNLTTQERPKVIVHTDGYPNLKAASSRIEVDPGIDLQAPVCPMVYN